MRRFFIGFALLGGVALGVSALAGDAVGGAVARGMAWSSGKVLALAGHDVRAEGHEVVFADRALSVGFECTALRYAVIFLCALAAWPAPWRRRLAALAAALGILYAMDIVRVTALVLLAGGRWFESAHVLSGALYVAILLVLWLVWTRLSGTPARVRLAHPAVAGAVALAFVFSMGELALGQGPPPPPPLAVPLGGAPFALAGVVASAWFLLRRLR